MLKYKGRDSKALTVLVGVAKLAADLKQPLGWDVEDVEECKVLNENAHPSDHVLAILENFGCFRFVSSDSDTDDPMVIEFGDGVYTDMARICRVVRDMPEYTEIMTVGIRPDCFD